MTTPSLLLLPEGLWRWPFPLLVPLSIYLLIVVLSKPLRQTADWLRVGRLTRGLIIIFAALISVVSSGALILYQVLLAPELSYMDRYLPLDLLGPPLGTAVIFSILNPILEEVVFRGILYQAFAAYWPWHVAAAATSVIFGAGHVGGYPPGLLGGILAGLYGYALAVLRRHSNGMLLVILVHAVADATIMALRTGPGES